MMVHNELEDQERKEKQGLEELEVLRVMVLRWKQSYWKIALEEEGGEFLADDLQEEIERLAVPYLLRLHETFHISASQLKEFLEFCENEVQELRSAMREEG